MNMALIIILGILIVLVLLHTAGVLIMGFLWLCVKYAIPIFLLYVVYRGVTTR